MLDTPEIEWRRIYGVMWDIESDEPLTQYTDIEEALQVAIVMGGYVVEKWFGFSNWTPCQVEEM